MKSDRLYESRHRSDDGRGRVTDPEHDRRLRERDEYEGRSERQSRGRGFSGNGGRYEDDEESGYRSRGASSRRSSRDEDYERRR